MIMQVCASGDSNASQFAPPGLKLGRNQVALRSHAAAGIVRYGHSQDVSDSPAAFLGSCWKTSRGGVLPRRQPSASASRFSPPSPGSPIRTDRRCGFANEDDGPTRLAAVAYNPLSTCRAYGCRPDGTGFPTKRYCSRFPRPRSRAETKVCPQWLGQKARFGHCWHSSLV